MTIPQSCHPIPILLFDSRRRKQIQAMTRRKLILVFTLCTFIGHDFAHAGYTTTALASDSTKPSQSNGHNSSHASSSPTAATQNKNQSNGHNSSHASSSPTAASQNKSQSNGHDSNSAGSSTTTAMTSSPKKESQPNGYSLSVRQRLLAEQNGLHRRTAQR